jgi:enolase
MQEFAMSMAIESIGALEILDSRGFPTLRVTVQLECGVVGIASVPSGASTGRHEAVELRDDDPARYSGRGVLRAVEVVRTRIREHLRGEDASEQARVDQRLIDLDGTEDKSALGANTIVGVSMAVARAAAAAGKVPLYVYLGGEAARRMPVPMLNLINGGKHANNGLDFQEFMIVPHGARSFTEGLRYAAETFHALATRLRKRGYSTGIGDEGGFAPALQSDAEACDLIMEAIRAAGFKPGRDIAMALDPAATSFCKEGGYLLGGSSAGAITSAQLLHHYRDLCATYLIVSIEDGFAEDDWAGFRAQTAMQGDRIQIVGDDLYATNPALIARGIDERASNAALIKLNQIGTVTETRAAIDTCRRAGWRWIISHRSGETEDAFIADFAVAMDGGQIKAGSVCRSERLAKYNRLLEIERELGASALYESPFQYP